MDHLDGPDKSKSRRGGSGTTGVPRLSYPQRSLIIYLIFLVFVIARYLQLGARRDFLASMRVELLLGLVVIPLVIYELISRKPNIGRSAPLIIAICVFLLMIIVQLPISFDPVMAKQMFMDRVIKFALLTFFMVTLIESPRYLGWFLAAFLFSVFYVTLESVQGLITGSLVWQNQGVMRLHGAVPIYQHPNSLGGVAISSLPFVVFIITQIRNKAMKLGLLAVCTTSMICVVYSGSRTAYVGLLAGIVWWFSQSPKKGRFLLFGLIGLAIGLAAIPDQYIERFESIGGQEKEGHSKETRMVILQDAWVILMENPFGVGVASFPAKRFQRFGRGQDTHNLYLEVATNLGWHGLAVFLWLVWAMMAHLQRASDAFRRQVRVLTAAAGSGGMQNPLRIRVGDHVRDLNFLVAVSRAAIGFILIRLVLGLFGMDLYEVYWWFGAGLGIVLSGLVVTTQRNTKVLLASMRLQAEQT